ncbi:hypothetical protein JXA40_06610 [bacterium]|nr:hypothetical protein [candidate division CSSED10-310 bacterium]
MTRHDPLKTVVVYLEFDSILQKITGTPKVNIVVSEGTPFMMLLDAVLETYSPIVQKYSVSALGFSVNGETPDPDVPLAANDIVSILVADDDRTLMDFFSPDYTQ